MNEYPRLSPLLGRTSRVLAGGNNLISGGRRRLARLRSAACALRKERAQASGDPGPGALHHSMGGFSTAVVF